MKIENVTDTEQLSKLIDDIYAKGHNLGIDIGSSAKSLLYFCHECGSFCRVDFNDNHVNTEMHQVSCKEVLAAQETG